MFTSALINAENIQNMKLILSKYTNIPIAGTVVLLLRNIKQNHSDNFSVAHSWVNYTKYLQGPEMLEMRNEDNNIKCKNNYKRTETDQISGNFYFWGHSWNGNCVFVAAAWVKINYIDKIRAIKSKRRQ